MAVENGEYIKMLHRMIKAGAKRVGAADEQDLKMFSDLKVFIDEQLKDAVRMQIKEGKSWTDIGAALGISRQAACKRFKGRL